MRDRKKSDSRGRDALLVRAGSPAVFGRLLFFLAALLVLCGSAALPAKLCNLINSPALGRRVCGSILPVR